MLPSTVPTRTKKWLSLLEAARMLGIHPATLRRWADAGEVDCMLTPGGHRRFAEENIREFEQKHGQKRQQLRAVQAWADQATARARREIQAHQNLPWLKDLGEQEREERRSLGKRLMGLIMNYISISEGGEALVDEASRVGKEYARQAIAFNLPVTVPIQAALFFRDTILETALVLPENASLHPEGNLRILKRISTILNAVELAIAESYE
jgi:excisionase family DNA binding protein